MESLFSVKRWELSGEGHVAAGWLIPRPSLSGGLPRVTLPSGDRAGIHPHQLH